MIDFQLPVKIDNSIQQHSKTRYRWETLLRRREMDRPHRPELLPAFHSSLLRIETTSLDFVDNRKQPLKRLLFYNILTVTAAILTLFLCDAPYTETKKQIVISTSTRSVIHNETSHDVDIFRR